MFQFLSRFIEDRIRLIVMGGLYILVPIVFFILYKKYIGTEASCPVVPNVSNPFPKPSVSSFIPLLIMLSLAGGICWEYAANRFSPFKIGSIYRATLCCFCISSFALYTLLNTFGLLPLQQPEPVNCQPAPAPLPFYR